MIDDIKQKAATGQYEYSRHAVDQIIKRRIAVHEVAEAIASQSLIIEDEGRQNCLQTAGLKNKSVLFFKWK